MAWIRRTRPSVSAQDRERAGLTRHDDVLAVQEIPQGQARLLVTTHHLVLLPDAGTPLTRPWHLVDHAGWRRDDELLTVTWVDDPTSWRLPITEPDTTALQALRERVQASVVTREEVRLGGRGSARVVIRQDLATRELLVQTLWGRGADPQDPEAQRAIARVTALLRDSVGLPPV